MTHSGTLWHYLGSFILYTLLAIGFIYAAYWAARKHSGNLIPAITKNSRSKTRLEVESRLTLEARKNLYVIRSGHERFLVATSADGTQLLSRLETDEALKNTVIQSQTEQDPIIGPAEPSPWYTHTTENTGSGTSTQGALDGNGLGSRFMQSVQWLLSARVK